jgi:hypothetical protein
MVDATIQLQLVRQYRAALAMLKQAIETCPEELWLDAKPRNKYWHIAYHALFYAHFYVQASDKDFVPWAKHQQDANFLGARPGAPKEPQAVIEPYSREDLLEYAEFCRNEVSAKVPLDNLDGPSGFYWLPFDRLELHLYNLRHLAHHTGQLADRLRNATGKGVGWVLQG